MATVETLHMKRAAELHDENLFKPPPPRDVCDICFHPLPLSGGTAFQSCCGKILCLGCIQATYVDNDRILCPFCRAPHTNSISEHIERLLKRVEANDANAIHNLGGMYQTGGMGFPQDYGKAMDLLLRAGELGSAESYYQIANNYFYGRGVKKSHKKSTYYSELAAMGGNAGARYNLGILEYNAGNMKRAVKHWMSSVGAGDDESLKKIKDAFMNGHATKDDFEKSLRSHKAAKDEMNVQRDAAAHVIAGQHVSITHIAA